VWISFKNAISFKQTLRETDRQTFSKKLQRKLEEKASNPSTIVDIQKKPIKYEKPCNLSKCLSVEDSIRLELIEVLISCELAEKNSYSLRREKIF